MTQFRSMTAAALDAVVCASAAVAPASAQPPAPGGVHRAFANPLQPWASPDRRVHLLRPATSTLTDADTPVGALISPGWRLIWNGAGATPGRVIVRLSLEVAPQAPQTKDVEYLQVGVSRAPQAVRTCVSYGLHGGSGAPLADRIISGRRFRAWSNGDAGMSQQIRATDLRTVASGACYAVERFAYGDTASPPSPAVTLTQARGAAELDAALLSLQIGPLRQGDVLQPPRLRSPPGAVAR